MLDSQRFFINHAFSLVFCWIQIIICFSLISVFNTSILEIATAQQSSSEQPKTVYDYDEYMKKYGPKPSVEKSEGSIKVLLDDAIQGLKSGNTNKTVQNLNAVSQILAQTNDNTPLIQASKLLIDGTIQDIQNGRMDLALTNLNFINQQLVTKLRDNGTSNTANNSLEKPVPSLLSALPDNGTSNIVNNSLEKPVPSLLSALPDNGTSSTVNNAASTGFLIYENHISGIKIQYPDSWSTRTYTYTKAGNNTVVGFYSPSKTASQLGNISGVSGQFVPYSDIFVFDSKNMSLDKIINGRINRIQNDTNSVIHESKPVTLKGNHDAHILVYSAATGGDELFKKMQLYTVFGNKVYLITFTSQEALFSNYLSVVQKMNNSFEISNKVTNVSNFDSIQ